MTLTFEFILFSSTSVTSETFTGYSGACLRVVPKTSWLISNDNSKKWVWFSLMMSWHTWIFTQMFRIPKYSVIIFQIRSFFMSSWLGIIWTINQRLATNNLPQPFDVNHKFCCWRPPTPEVVFDLLASFFELLAPFKKHAATWYIHRLS